MKNKLKKTLLSTAMLFSAAAPSISQNIFADEKVVNTKKQKVDVDKLNRKEYVKGFNDGTYFDHDKFVEAFGKLLNEDRRNKGLKEIIVSELTQEGTTVRAKEQALIGSQQSNGVMHQRPNGDSWKTAFKEESNTCGECIAKLLGPSPIDKVSAYTMRVYGEKKSMSIQNEADVAKALFTTWKNSPAHYQIMMYPTIESYGVAVRMAQAGIPNVHASDYNGIIGVFNISR